MDNTFHNLNVKKNITKTSVLMAVLSASLLTGCQGGGTYKMTVGCQNSNGPSGSTNECRVEGTIEGAFLSGFERDYISPLFEMIAQATGFTYSEWEGLDVSDFSLTLSGTTSASSHALVKVYDAYNLVGEKSFSVTKSGNEYKFSNPNDVKNWSLQFVDIGEKVDVEFEVNEVESFSAALKEGNTTRASSTYRGSGSEEPPEDHIGISG